MEPHTRVFSLEWNKDLDIERANPRSIEHHAKTEVDTMTKQPKIVLIEGNFSAGKTTLAEHLNNAILRHGKDSIFIPCPDNDELAHYTASLFKLYELLYEGFIVTDSHRLIHYTKSPTAAIFLKCGIDKCKERVKKRMSQQEEPPRGFEIKSDIIWGYCQFMLDHMELLFKKTSFVLSLDWNEDLDDEGLKRKSDEIAEALIKSE